MWKRPYLKEVHRDMSVCFLRPTGPNPCGQLEGAAFENFSVTHRILAARKVKYVRCEQRGLTALILQKQRSRISRIRVGSAGRTLCGARCSFR